MEKLTTILRTGALLLTASLLLLTHLASEAGAPKTIDAQRESTTPHRTYLETWKGAIQGVKLEAADSTSAEIVRTLRRNGFATFQPVELKSGQTNPAIIWAAGQPSSRKREPQLIDDPAPIRRQLQAIPPELKRGPLREKFSLPRR